MSRSKKNWDRLVNPDGNYGIDISKGIWPGSGVANKGDLGPKGEPGQKGARGAQGNEGEKGDAGPQGEKGFQGPHGDSAYKVAVDAGFIGSEAEWLASLKGETGEKGVLGEKGSFDDLTQAQIDSLKGDIGSQGEKGEAGGVFEFKGSEADLAAIEALPGPHAAGDVYRADDTDNLYVYDGTSFVLLTEAVDVVKGQKGEDGNDGEKGNGGEKGEKGTVGPKGENGEDGSDGAHGKSAFEVAQEAGFGGTEAEWLESLKGEQGDEGQKGATGGSAYDLSQKGLDPNDQVTEDVWLDSLKGDKGDNFDPVVLDNYYTKGQVEERLEQQPQPEDSYDINFMPDSNEIASGDAADFNDLDATAAIFNPGLVSVLPGATVDNSPVTAPFLIRNTVIKDDSGVRDSSYAVLQEVTQLSAGSVASVVRTARPGTGTFSPWSENTFASGNYYNKVEVDAKVDGINYDFSQSNGAITLTDKDSAVQIVQLLGTGGIAISSDEDNLIIDGTALTPVPQFLGLLEDGQDPEVITGGNAIDGNYFVYAYTGVTVGTTPDTQDCTPGDWCINDAGNWTFLDITSDPGVVSVGAGGGLLTVNSADPANPIINLDTNDVVTPLELESYLEKNTFAAASTSRRLGDLIDVEIAYARTMFANSTSHSVYALQSADGSVPSQAGERSTDLENNKVLLFNTSSTGDALVELYNNIDVLAEPPQLFRVSGVGVGVGGGQSRVDTIVSKSINGNVLEIVTKNASVALFSSGFEGEVVFDIVTGEATNGGVLSYDSTDHAWKVGKAADYVQKDGDTMSGPLVIDSRDSVSNGDKTFSVSGIQANGGVGDSILSSVKKDAGGDQVHYYGPVVSDKEVTTKEYVDGGFLPFTGGTLQGDTASATLVVKGSPNADPASGNVLKVVNSANDEILSLRQDQDAVFAETVKAKGTEVTNVGTTISTTANSTEAVVSSSANMQLKAQDNAVWADVDTTKVAIGLTQADTDPSLAVDDSSVFLYRPLLLGTDAGTDGQVLVSKGNAIAPEWQTLSNLSDFVRKDGGIMTGDLGMSGNVIKSLAPDGWDAASEFGLKIDISNNHTHYNHFTVGNRVESRPSILDIWDDGGGRVEVNGRQTVSSPESSTNAAFKVNTGGLAGDLSKSAFSVLGDGSLCGGPDALNPFLASESHHLTTKAYFDSELAGLPLAVNMLPLSGGTMTGTLVAKLVKSTRNTGYAFEVKPDDVITRGSWNTSGRLDITMASTSDAAIRTIGSIHVKKDGEGLSGDSIFVAGPTRVTYAGPQDTNSCIVTKQYADSLMAPKPAQMMWVWAGDINGSSAPADGKFYKGGDYLRFSFKTHNGVDLGKDVFGDTGSITTDDGPIGTIWFSEGNGGWRLKRQFRSNSFRWNFNNHFEFGLSSSKGIGWSSLALNTEFYVTIGGWF